MVILKGSAYKQIQSQMVVGDNIVLQTITTTIKKCFELFEHHPSNHKEEKRTNRMNKTMTIPNTISLKRYKHIR